MKYAMLLIGLVLSTAAYADVKISELPAAAILSGGEIAPVVQANTTVGATVDQIRDLTLSDLSQSGLFNVTGGWSFQRGATSGVSSVTLASSNPILEWNRTTSAADNRRWRAFAGTTNWQLGPCADDGTTCSVAMQLSRNAAAVTAIDLQATAVRANGSNICTADGTNCPTGLTLASGTYAPTCTPGTNVSACSTSFQWNYQRVGSIVTVSGPMLVNITANGVPGTQFLFSVPIASAFTSSSASGTCASINSTQSGTVSSLNGGPSPYAVFTSETTGNDNMACIFTYRIQ